MCSDPHKAYEALCYRKPKSVKKNFKIYDEKLVDNLITKLGAGVNLDFGLTSKNDPAN